MVFRRDRGTQKIQILGRQQTNLLTFGHCSYLCLAGFIPTASEADDRTVPRISSLVVEAFHSLVEYVEPRPNLGMLRAAHGSGSS